MTEIYVSTDVETDGPIPGSHSLLSFASAAYRADKTLLGTFRANVRTLPEARPDPHTAAWWKTQPEAWEASTRDPREPDEAMKDYRSWVETLPGTPVFVAFPLAFDFLFIHWYLIRFTGGTPFWYRGVDIRSYAMAMMKGDYGNTGRKHIPATWFDDLPHTHDPLDDALEQGALFCNMLAINRPD